MLRSAVHNPIMGHTMGTSRRADGSVPQAFRPNPVAGVPTNPIFWIISLGLLYAGYKRGQKIERKPGEAPMICPFIGWSLLGPVGPGYLIGRLTS
jgi:hypothetical protein